MGHPVGKFPVLFAIKNGCRDLCPGNEGIVIKIAQVKTAGQHTQQAPVNVFFLDQPALNAFGQRLVGIILPDALHIGPGQYAFGSGMNRGGRYFVRSEEVRDGSAVGNHDILETPFITQDALQQAGTAAAGFVIYPLIGTHDLAHTSFLYQGLESRQVGFV
ncbi:MAG: hypothetical protein BWX93_01944 [Bacteroidetes bacterium ADurb.Bin139]|nr:MAG: hypothetical protein BWX93_01944 [Bacteroidetes bacterium ADurb.Bin139]